MVIKTKKPISKYEEFFAMEADDNTKGTKIKKAKLDNTVTDYTDDANPDTEKKDDSKPDNTVTDDNDDGTDAEDQDKSDNPDDATYDDGTDYTDNPDDGTQSEDQSSTESDDGTDYTDNPDDADSPDTSTEEDSPDEDVQTQKYNLYREFMRLYSSIKRYTNKLENTVRDDINGNMVIISVTKRLNEIQDLIYEYLTVKFHGAEYAEALLYFHSCIETIELTFKLLKNNEIFIKQ